MNKSVRKYYEKQLEKLIPELKKRNIDALYCETADQARAAVLEMIPRGSSVHTGGSVTLRECGIVDALKTGPYEYYNQTIQSEDDESRRYDLRRRATTADYCLGSINALSLTGEIVNIDGGGSRIGGYVYGAKKVILVTGVNKIVPSLEEALRRARHFAAVANSFREDKVTPCAGDGICHESECYPPERQCGKVLIIEKESRPGRITVVFVGEQLGL
ncbi:MAG: lactate utilization protein [Chloroflexi bacterium]|nr:lactate utilization protein [Chloroflexota bacterium]